MALVRDKRLGELPLMVVSAGNNLTNLDGHWAMYQRELPRFPPTACTEWSRARITLRSGLIRTMLGRAAQR